MKFHWEDLVVPTGECNLNELDPKLKQFMGDYDMFHITDLTERFESIIDKSGIMNGQITAQCMHTTTVLAINELDEPMLLMDLHRNMLKFAPRVEDYLHNSAMRTVNRCDDDLKCDRNADAHIKAFMVGNQTNTMLIREGKLVKGRWQRIAFIDFDGPRDRNVMVQVSGE